MIHHIQRKQIIRQPLKHVFRFFADAYNLEKITPAFLAFKVTTPRPIVMRAGTLIDYHLKLHGLPLRWTSRIDKFERWKAFKDTQIKGPYARWEHEHSFETTSEGTRVIDEVRYELPLDPLSRPIHWLFVRKNLETIFDYRHKAVGLMFEPSPSKE